MTKFGNKPKYTTHSVFKFIYEVFIIIITSIVSLYVVYYYYYYYSVSGSDNKSQDPKTK